ncbi:MAG TPA: hypothetical protein VE990_15605 [Acidimicrobiales bacterium]|nr:hypothetical protein [Acidimicrobiales bacterium]
MATKSGGEMARSDLVYIYGPPAVGKLTVAKRLAVLTGYALFHNHLTVDAVKSVFPWGSDGFNDVLHRLRLDVFETAAREGISLIFTNNSAWSGPEPRRRFACFADEAATRVERAGGRVVFVRLHAPLGCLEDRVDGEDRRQLGKLTEADRLRQLVGGIDQAPLHPSDLSIDTSRTDPGAAAQVIVEALGSL